MLCLVDLGLIVQSVKILCLAIHIQSRYKAVKNIIYIYIYGIWVYLYSYTCKAINRPLAVPFYLQMLCLVDRTARQTKINGVTLGQREGERSQRAAQHSTDVTCASTVRLRHETQQRWTHRHHGHSVG